MGDTQKIYSGTAHGQHTGRGHTENTGVYDIQTTHKTDSTKTTHGCTAHRQSTNGWYTDNTNDGEHKATNRYTALRQHTWQTVYWQNTR